jgi:hypothetical protein
VGVVRAEDPQAVGEQLLEADPHRWDDQRR